MLATAQNFWDWFEKRTGEAKGKWWKFLQERNTLCMWEQTAPDLLFQSPLQQKVISFYTVSNESYLTIQTLMRGIEYINNSLPYSLCKRVAVSIRSFLVSGLREVPTLLRSLRSTSFPVFFSIRCFTSFLLAFNAKSSEASSLALGSLSALLCGRWSYSACNKMLLLNSETCP